MDKANYAIIYLGSQEDPLPDMLPSSLPMDQPMCLAETLEHYGF